MELSRFPESVVLENDQIEKDLLKYTRPTLLKLGTVTDTTAGAVGSAVDLTAPTGGYPRQ